MKRQREFTLTFNLDSTIELDQSKAEPEKTIQKFILAIRKVMNVDPRIRSMKACHRLHDAKGDVVGQWSINNQPRHYELHAALRVLRDKFATSSRLVRLSALNAIAALEYLIETADDD